MTTQPRPKKPQQLNGTPVGKLLNQHNISLSMLVRMLGETGFKTSTPMLSRFVNEKLHPEYMKSFATAVAKVLPGYLLENSDMTKAEIDLALQEIFTEGEYQPMASKRIALTDAECRYFDLIADVEGKLSPLDPFKNPPASRSEVYFPPAYMEIYDRVIDAIKYRHFIAVLGKIGSGKTTLRAMVEDHVAGEDNLVVVWPEFFDQSKVSAFEIAKSIMRETGPENALIPGRAGALGKAVTKRLQGLTQNGHRVAIAFDECHKMNRTSIRSLKNFHEMSSGGFQKYLGIVLFGWPTFESMLMDPEFQEIYERVDVVEMPDFKGELAAGYLEHRLRLVGRTTSDVFDADAAAFITANAETPLQLGNLANQALRISRESFDEKIVTGAAIRTKMFFESRASSPAFRKR